MLNLGPFSTRSHKFTLNDTETEGKTPTHSIRQEPHLYRPKRKLTLSLRREDHGGQTEGGHSNLPKIPDYLI